MRLAPTIAVACMRCLASAGCLALAACSGDDLRRAEAARLVDALQSIDISAPERRREARLAELRALVLHDAEFVRVRDQCVAVHAGLLTAEHEQADAARALKEAVLQHRGQPVPPAEADRIAQAIARSEAAWEAAKTALPACDAATRDLVLRKR